MQPPSGYPQQPQNPQGPQQAPPGYGQQAYPPQYGMQQQPYYPQQKKGMPGWAWVLIICGVVFILCPIGGIFVLAAIPLVASNTKEARKAEGEQMMGMARDAARVEYSKTGSNPGTFSSFMSTFELSGIYYNIDDPIRDVTTSGPAGFGGGYKKAEITCTPVTPSDGKGRCEFSWADGNSQIRWE